MTLVQQIQTEIRSLPEDDLRALREWFDAFDSARWDDEIEQDVARGRLDALADEALREVEAMGGRRL